MTSQEEEKVYQNIMGSQKEENVYQLLHASTWDKSRDKNNQEIMRSNSKKAEEMTKSQKICVCLLASLVAVALLVAGIALLLTSIHFGIGNAMMDSCLSQSNSTVINQQSNSNNQIAELQTATLSQLVSQISSLQSQLNYSNDQIAELQAQQSTLFQQVSSILAKVIEADNKLLVVIRHFGQLTSCSDLPPGTPSGTYNNYYF